jgi:CheY-like chemotaxis protein
MLVEDDKSLREIYSIRLVAEGYDIVSAGDGEEALSMAVRERPDLIISDVMMPKISGFDMLDILRSTPETKDIKVIMMTALSSEEQRKRGENLGADRYLVKSQVGIEDVINVVHEVLGDRPSTNAVANMKTVSTVASATAAANAAAAPQPTAPATPTAAAPAPTPQAAPAAPVQGQAPVPAPVSLAPQQAAPAAAPAPTPQAAPAAPVQGQAPVPAPAQAPVQGSPAAPAPVALPAPVADPASVPASMPVSAERATGERVVQPINPVSDINAIPESDMARRMEAELSGTPSQTPVQTTTDDMPEMPAQ